MSPDGRWAAYSCAKDRAGTRFSLKRVALESGRPTGRPETICDLPQGASFAVGWASDRDVAFSPESETTIYAVAVSGGAPRIIHRVERSEGIEGWSDFVPLVAGKTMLATHFSIASEKIKINTEAIDLASGKRTTALADSGGARIVTDARRGETLLVASRADQTGLVAVRFDADSLRTLGDPVTVWSGNAVNQYCLSANGTLALSTRPNDFSDRRLALLDEKGLPQPIPGPTRAFSEIVVSPDGGRVLANLEVVTPDELSTELWVQDLERRTSTRIPIQGFAMGLLWSNNGQRIVHGSFAKEEFSITERPAGGPGDTVKMFTTPLALAQQSYVQPSAWSPDGKSLAIVRTDMKVNSSDVLMLHRESGSETWKATPYMDSPADEHALKFSPDGKRVLFCSVDSGRHELYVQPFTGVGSADAAAGRVRVSTNGHDGQGWWSPDGTEIRFIDADRQVVSVEVKSEPAISVSMPKVLYSIKELKIRNFAWMPDGRLMVILQGENELASRIDLVINFADEMRARMRSTN